MPARAHEDAVFSAWESVLAAPAETKVHVVFVLGRDGGGKSALLDALAQRARAGAAHRVVTARWLSGGDYLEPLLETVEGRLFGGRLISKTKHQLLRRSTSALSILPGGNLGTQILNMGLSEVLARRTPIDTALSDHELQGAYAWRLRELCASTPRLALLDNAERLDAVGPAAWRFFGELAGFLAGLPALFVVACHTASSDARHMPDVIARSFRPGSYRIVTLPDREAEREAEATARELLAGCPQLDRAEHIDALVKLTHGDDRELRHAIDVLRAAGGDETAWRGVVADSVQRELGGWTPRDRQIAELLATTAEPDERALDTDAFHRYWNLGVREVQELLHRAAARLAVPAVREALRAAIPEVRQRADHQALAAALLEAYGRAGDPGLLDAAARELKLAGDDAGWSAALTAAARVYDEQDRAGEALVRYRALDAAGGVTDDREAHLELLLRAAHAAYRSGDAAEVDALARRVETIAAGALPALAASARAQTALLRAQAAIHGANADRGATALAALDRVLAFGDPGVEARARCEKAFCLVASDPHAARVEAERGLAAARARGARADELYGLQLLGEVLARSGSDTDEAERCLLAVAGADDAGPRLRSHALDSLANLYARAGRFGDAAARFADSRELKSSLGDHRGLAITTGGQARLYHRWGKLEQAASYYDLDLDLIAEHTPDDAAAFVQVNNLRAEVARMSGDRDGARQRLAASLARLDALPPAIRPRAEGYTLLLRARLALDEGQPAEAAADLAEAIVPFADLPALRAEVQIELARIALAHRSGPQAVALLEAARAALTEPYAGFQLELVAIAAAAVTGDDAAGRAARARAAAIARLLDNAWMLEQLE